MKIKDMHPFNRMVLGAFSGSLLGMAAGLIISYIIFVILLQIPSGGAETIPTQLPLFLGMGGGAVIGSLLGGISINKN
ncbi:hypothetical protein CO046_04175 [Candidatus Peregrinibacteria bacterium CG_4_9_14_0_2_um_filter_53_11]|nr:MAG: hypothetical protein CO046_04175 [Candidatus Peregrinibacteria bacterium CG_4_9_14_0_2_um_filter_53_11]